MFRRLSFSKLVVLGALTAAPLVTSSAASAQEQAPPATTPPLAPISPSAPVAPAPPVPAEPPPPVPPPHAISAPPGPPGAGPHAPRVPTTVDSGTERHAILERRITTEEQIGRFAFVLPIHTQTEKWEQVCVAPCRVDLDRHSAYRVARGNNVPSTGSFTLPPESGNLHLQIEPGNLLMHRIGTRLIVAGTAAAIVGGALITTAAKFEDEKDIRLGGIITGAAGLVLLGIGIPLAIVSQTHVKTNDKPLASAAPRPSAKPGPKLTLGGVVF